MQMHTFGISFMNGPIPHSITAVLPQKVPIVTNTCILPFFYSSLPTSQETKGLNSVSTTLQTSMEQTKQIFQKKAFVVLCIGTVLHIFSASVVFTHMVAFAESEKISSKWSSLIVSVSGAASLGRQAFLHPTSLA